VKAIALTAALLVLAAGCGSGGDQEGEDYGNLLESPGGLVVLEQEHPDGWGHPECFACHMVRNIHTVNRTGLPDEDVDLEGVRDIVDSQGTASCSLCHGDNGVPP
jgi:hypothetical protein